MKKRVFITPVALMLLFIFTGSCGSGKSKVSGATVSLESAFTLPTQSFQRYAQEFFQRGLGDIRAFGAQVRQH